MHFGRWLRTKWTYSEDGPDYNHIQCIIIHAITCTSKLDYTCCSIDMHNLCNWTYYLITYITIYKAICGSLIVDGVKPPSPLKVIRTVLLCCATIDDLLGQSTKIYKDVSQQGSNHSWINSSSICLSFGATMSTVLFVVQTYIATGL